MTARLGTLADWARPYSRALLVLALLTTVSSIVMLAIPWLAGQIVGGIVTGVVASDGLVIGWLLGALGLIALLNYAIARRSSQTAAEVLADIRVQAFEHIQRLPIGFHESRGRGDMLALMTFELNRLSQFLTGTLVSIPSKLLTTAGAIVLMFRIDPGLALIVPLLIPAFYLILKIVGRRLRGLGQSLQETEAEVVELAEQMLEMVPATKAFTREAKDAERYRGKIAEATDLRVREGRIYAALDPLIGLIAATAAVLLLVFAGKTMAAGQMSAAELFSFIFYAALLTRPVGALAHVYGETQTVLGTLARLQSVLDQPVEQTAGASPRFPRASGHIAYDGVHFAFAGRGPLLDGIDLTIEPGEVVALVGANGSGKTALISLLLRYYAPDRGRIAIDGRDIAGMSVAELRQQIGLVPQLPLLFNGTIRENIAYGALDPSDEMLDRAIHNAQAEAFIAALPNGLETRIGDRGVRLSGGQRQRIALARALIKDPPILIFDEATSMFDEQGEQAFIDLSTAALEGRTVILITHRPATLALASRIFDLSGGKLSGRHQTRQLKGAA